ncbi:MAG TPA: hypothetical protein VHZ81_06665 [Galbitalea sp.]|jgi:hypothetical protein|nr:hypothetical protein [Galbitalea sp.]
MVISQHSSSSATTFRRAVLPIVLASVVALGLAACTSAGSGTAAGGSGPSTGSGTGAATATFSGSESGTAAINLCASSGSFSIFVTVAGTNTKLPGVVSATSMDFDGKDSIYTIDKTGPLPQVSSGGNSVTLDGVVLKSVIDSSKKVTFAGKVTCP